MKQACFNRFGWLHLSISVPGAVVFLAAVVFCINVFLAIGRRCNTRSAISCTAMFPFFACTFLLVDRIARSTSRL